MVEIIGKIAEITAKGIEKLSEAASGVKEMAAGLDRPLNDAAGIEKRKSPPAFTETKNIRKLDSPLYVKDDAALSKNAEHGKERVGIREIRRMEPPITIKFTCPEGVDKKEFTRQIKGQERGLNSQTLAENMDNRRAFEQRKEETGNGRDLKEGKKAQDIAREKATQSRIESNQKKGMSYSEAKLEAKEWIQTQSALHNPDQIAGGDPAKVSRMGDSNVNSSIGSQWRSRVSQLEEGIGEYAKDKTRKELENTKMNVKLVVT